MVKSWLFTSVASLSFFTVAGSLKFKSHSWSEKHVFKMERSSVCQIISSFPNFESLLEQSSILLQTCDDPLVNSQALLGMEEPGSGGQENISPLLEYLETVNLLEYQEGQEQAEVQQQELGEEIFMTVDDPELIQLAEESRGGRMIAVTDETSSDEQPATSSSADVVLQSLLQDGLTHVELEDVDWVPPEASRPEPSGRKKGKNKHRKGRLQRPLDEIRKENQSNVLRCRVYRSQKKQKEEKKLTSLKQLELENKELKRKEEEVKEKRDRVQNAYLALINYGRIKFTVGF